MKYIAIFDIPDDYVMGRASGMMCPNDGKVRSDKEYEHIYANIEPLSEKQNELWERYKVFERILSDLGISNSYDMPSFWCNKGKDYTVIPTKFHKGYQKALEDIERAVRLRLGFAEREGNIGEYIMDCN